MGLETKLSNCGGWGYKVETDSNGQVQNFGARDLAKSYEQNEKPTSLKLLHRLANLNFTELFLFYQPTKDSLWENWMLNLLFCIQKWMNTFI